jgi:hypothetical protein
MEGYQRRATQGSDRRLDHFCQAKRANHCLDLATHEEGAAANEARLHEKLRSAARRSFSLLSIVAVERDFS